MTTDGPEAPAPEPPVEPAKPVTAAVTTEAEPAKPATVNLTSERMREHLEFVLRIGVMLAALAYFTGLLVVLKHHATFGVFDMDLLRPRVIAAGVVFLVMLALSLLAVGPYAWWSEPKTWLSGHQRIARRIIEGGFYVSTAVLLAFLLGLVLLDPLARDRPASATSLLIMVGVGLASFVCLIASLASRRLLWPGAVAVGAAVGWAAVVAFRTWPRAELELTFWILLVGVLASNARGTMAPSERPWYAWFDGMTVLVLSGIVVSYAINVHGNVSASWGGGYPRPVTIYLRSEQPFIEGTEIKVRLIDETSNGFYVIPDATKNEALFIPRDQVAAVRHVPALSPWRALGTSDEKAPEAAEPAVEPQDEASPIEDSDPPAIRGS